MSATGTSNHDPISTFKKSLEASKHVLVKSCENLELAMANFKQWAVDQNIKLNGVECGRRNDMNCVLVKEPLKEGDLVIKVPRAAMITEEEAWRSPIGEFMLQDITLKASPHLILSLYILSIKNTENPWKPYINLLPTSFSTPFYFDQEALDVVKGTMIYEEVTKRMKTLLGQFFHLKNILKPKMKQFFGVEEPLEFKDFMWCVSVTMTRQNRIPKPSENGTILALIPVWDFCNHCDGDIRTFYDTDSQAINSLSNRNYAPGQELFM
jgi:protein-histidine N-methyltransferase